MKKILIGLMSLFLLAAVPVFSKAAGTNKADVETAPSKSYSLKKQHEGLACVACHGDAPAKKYYLADSGSCLKCHGSREAVAERTKSLDVGDINPHRGYHYGATLECHECHRQHQPSRNYCANCHDVDQWMKPTP